LGFATEKIDGAHRVLLTKWRQMRSTGLEWLPDPVLPVPYEATRVQFLVFVSPFVEPARISVGSIIETTDNRTPASRGVVYNASNVNDALLAEIIEALGEPGLEVPKDLGKRREAARSLLKGDPGACGAESVPRPEGKPTPPKKIPLSEFEFLYPAEAAANRTEGKVAINFVILEDGTVADIRVLGGPHPPQLQLSATGAASLLLFRPTMLMNCAVPSLMTYIVRYRLR
jgi:TonB family protein